MKRDFVFCLLAFVAGMAGPGGFAMAETYPATPCVSLAEIAATRALHSSALLPLTGRGGSYRVSEVRWDAVLGQRWEMVASCEHPEQPAFAILANEAITGKPAYQRTDDSAPVVRAGDVVRLWRQEEKLRIEMTAMSEESGGMGKAIRVRVMGANSVERQFVGVVRGVGDVEMRP